MKKQSYLLLALISLLGAVSCKKVNTEPTTTEPTSDTTNSQESSSSSSYEEGETYQSDILKAEVGYDYILPESLTSKNNLIIIDVDNVTELEISYGKVHFSTMGDAKATYDDGQTIIKVVDTEKPMFLPLWGQQFNWNVTYPYYIYKDEVVDLNDIFVATDNSGIKPTTWFELYYLGTEKVTLTDGSKFKVRGGEGSDQSDYYYDAIAHAKDSSGNAVYMTQKLSVAIKK